MLSEMEGGEVKEWEAYLELLVEQSKAGASSDTSAPETMGGGG